MAKYDPVPSDAYAPPQGPETSAMVQMLIDAGMGGLIGLLPSLSPIQSSLAMGMAPLAEDLGTTTATNAVQDQQSMLADWVTMAMAGPGAFNPEAFNSTPGEAPTYTVVPTPGRDRLNQLASDSTSASMEAFIARALLGDDNHRPLTTTEIRAQVADLYDQWSEDPDSVAPEVATFLHQIPLTTRDENGITTDVPDFDYVLTKAEELDSLYASDPVPTTNDPMIDDQGNILMPGSRTEYITDANGNQVLVEISGGTPDEPSYATEQFTRLGLSPPTDEYTVDRLMGDDWKQALTDYMSSWGDPEVRSALLEEQTGPMNQEIAAYDWQNQDPYLSPEDYARQQRPDLFTGGQGVPAAPAPAPAPSGGGGGGLGGIPTPDFGWAGPLEPYLGATPLTQGLGGVPGLIAAAAGAVPAPDFSWAGPLEDYLTATPLLRSLLGGGSAQAAGPGGGGGGGAVPDNSSIIQQMLGATPLTQGLSGIPDMLGGGVTGGVSPTLNRGANAPAAPAGPSGPPSRQQAMGQGAGPSAFNIPGVNDPQLASLLSQLSTTNLPTWNSYLQSQGGSAPAQAAQPQASSPTAQAAQPQAGSAPAVAAMLQRIMPSFIGGGMSSTMPAVLAQAQAGGQVQAPQQATPAAPRAGGLQTMAESRRGSAGMTLPREAILRFIMDRSTDAQVGSRATSTGRRIETEQETNRYEAENRLAGRRSRAREQVFGGDFGRNVAYSNALRRAGIRPIDMELAARNQVLAQAGLRPA